MTALKLKRSSPFLTSTMNMDPCGAYTKHSSPAGKKEKYFRNQNMIKNKFYSTLRSLVRLLVLCGCKNLFPLKKLPTMKISSKVLVEIYDGKRGNPSFNIDFKKFRGLLPKCLKMIEYDLDERRI